MNIPYPPNADKETRKGYKNVRSRAGQNLIYLVNHSPNSIYPGFEELWNYYFSIVDSTETSERTIYILLQMLFVVKYVVPLLG
jgi:hypothetical protein